MNIFTLITSLFFTGIGAIFIWRKTDVWKFFKNNTDRLGIDNKYNYSESPIYARGKKDEVNWIGRFGVYFFALGLVSTVLILISFVV